MVEAPRSLQDQYPDWIFSSFVELKKCSIGLRVLHVLPPAGLIGAYNAKSSRRTIYANKLRVVSEVRTYFQESGEYIYIPKLSATEAVIA